MILWHMYVKVLLKELVIQYDLVAPVLKGSPDRAVIQYDRVAHVL